MRTLLTRFLLLLMLSATAHAQSSAAPPVPLDRIVAVVNNDVIVKTELDAFLRTVKAQLRSSNMALPPEDVLEKQGLDRLIMTRLQMQLAKRTGIRVNDETLNHAIQDIAQRNKMSMDQFRATLKREGYSFATFRENIRDQIIITRLQQRNVDSHIRVSDQEVNNFLADQRNLAGQNRMYKLQQILIALPDAASPKQIQAARDKAQKVLTKLRSGADFGSTAVAVSDGQKALDGGNLGWFRAGQIPSLYATTVLAMKPGQISDIIRSPSGFHIVRLADTKGQQKHIVQQTHARQILIRTSELVSDADARNRLEQLRQRILNGDDFAELARSHSDDTLSARKGGDLGWLSPGDTVPTFEHAMDALTVGQISEPIRTRFGWHIIQVLGRRQHDNTEEYKRSQAREAIRARKQQEALELWLRRLRDEAYVKIRLNS